MFSIIGVLASLALAGGSVGYFMFPTGLSMGIKMAINLAEDGMVYPLWSNPPFPVLSSFSLFAITNPREVLRGEKMSFTIKGPYNYDAYLTRDKVMFMSGGEKINYETGRKMIPLEDKSANFDEKMWLLNPILPSTASMVRSLVIDRVPFPSVTEPVVFGSVNLLLDQFKERLIVRTTPRMILNGRKVELLESVSNLAGRFGLSSLVPPGPPENTFGVAFFQNASVDQIEIWTGVGKTKDKFAEVSKWKDKTALDVWRGKCNSIEGTNGELFKPSIKQGQEIRVFLGPLCRSFLMKPLGNGTVTTKSGVRALQYTIDPDLYKGSRNNPKNKCFCDNPKTYDCQLDGLLTMGSCFFNAPIFLTKAKFKDADNRIKRLVDFKSIEQDPLPDEQTFSLEPITGTVLAVNLTLMAVFKVTRQSYMRDMSNIRNLTYAPLFATTEAVSLDWKYVWQLYYLQTFYDYHKPIMAGTAGVGLGVLAFRQIF